MLCYVVMGFLQSNHEVYSFFSDVLRPLMALRRRLLRKSSRRVSVSAKVWREMRQRRMPRRVYSMPTVVVCPECHKRARVPEQMLGKNVRCPACGATFPATDGPAT